MVRESASEGLKQLYIADNPELNSDLSHLDPEKYRTDFDLDGCSNYALNLVLKEADSFFCQRVIEALKSHRVEFRRGSADGGNQLRQPYLRRGRVHALCRGNISISTVFTSETILIYWRVG
jgi:hypothetical protein